MPINIKKSKTALTPVVRFYVAEDLRQEINGMVSAIGLYPDNVILLQVPSDIPDPTEEKPILIRSLGFLFNISKISGDTTISVFMKSNGKLKPFMNPTNHKFPGPDKSLNLLAIMQPCAITSFGEKTVVVKVDEATYNFYFEVIKSPIAPNTAAQTKAEGSTKAPNKTRAKAKK